MSMLQHSILSDNYYFVPAGAKTYGAYGPQGIKLIKQIGKKECKKLQGSMSSFRVQLDLLDGHFQQ